MSASDEILRFRKSERQLHWAIAIPFMVSYVTAVILVAVYNPNPARPFRDVVSWIHRISGVCLIAWPLWTIVRHRPDLRVYLDNIRQAWTWTRDDVRWLFLMAPSAVNPKITLPDQGKFNAAEKINFMVLVSTYPAYIVTGLLIWLPGVAYLSWMVHFGMAVAATPLMLGHIFMATVNPDTRVGLSGMISGFVDRQWARHHYRRWYEEQFELPVHVKAVPAVAAPRVTHQPRPAVAPVAAAPRVTHPPRPAVVAPVAAAPRVAHPPRPAVVAPVAAPPRVAHPPRPAVVAPVGAAPRVTHPPRPAVVAPVAAAPRVTHPPRPAVVAPVAAAPRDTHPPRPAVVPPVGAPPSDTHQPRPPVVPPVAAPPRDTHQPSFAFAPDRQSLSDAG